MILYFEPKYDDYFDSRSVFPKVIEEDGIYKVKINLAGTLTGNFIKTSGITNLSHVASSNIYEITTSNGNSKWVFIGEHEGDYQKAVVQSLDNDMGLRKGSQLIISYDASENIILEYNGKIWNMGKIISSEYTDEKTIFLHCERNFLKFFYA